MPQEGKRPRRMVIDLGNTRLKMGLFEGDVLKHKATYIDGAPFSQIWQKWQAEWQPVAVALSSTARLISEDVQWLESHRTLIPGPHLKFPFQIDYKTPESLGQDRLAAVSAVDAFYRGENILVIDSGTCITYDLLLADGHYLGGNIAPGIRMRLRSMHEYTQRLPLVEPPEEVQWIGQSTSGALQSGGVSMAIMEARGLIFYLLEKYGSLRTVLTGGDAEVFNRFLPGDVDVIDDLVLVGLNEILKNNEV